MSCQNRLCHYNNTTDRLRAKKSPKPYYVNRTAKAYFHMFCSQGCLIRAIGEQGKRTRLKTDPTPSEAFINSPEYNLTVEQGYYEARQRFYETWISNHVRD